MAFALKMRAKNCWTHCGQTVYSLLSLFWKQRRLYLVRVFMCV